MYSLTLEMYMPQCKEGGLKVLHSLEIKSFLQYISECKSHLTNQFCKIEIDLKSISSQQQKSQRQKYQIARCR